MRSSLIPVATLAGSTLMLSGCLGGGGDDGAHGVRFDKTVSVPGISSAVVYSFDLGAVDSATGIYYLTDRTNKSVDVYNPATGTVTQFLNAGFAGCRTSAGAQVNGCLSGVNSDSSGPDGLDVVGQNLYVGDVNALWIMDKTTGAVVKKIDIPSSPTGLRADEGCFDRDDNIYAIATPGADNPFMTFIDTTTQAVIATVVMNDAAGAPSGGLEACVYDATTKTFFVNNDGSTANPHGETDGIPARAIVALKPGGPSVKVNFTSLAGAFAYALPPLCDPTGIARGPRNDLGVLCRPGTVGTPMKFVILDVLTGKVTDQIAAGGGDQMTYDPASDQWYLADNRWTATGNSCAGGSASCPLTPVLAVVRGSTHEITMLPTGSNSHSVAVGGGHIYSPFTAPTTTTGGAAFPNGGLNVFTTF